MKPTFLSNQAIECLDCLEENLENAVTILVVSSHSVCLRNIANELADYIRSTFPEARYSKSLMTWALGNGSRVIFRVVGQSRDYDRLRGIMVDKVIYGPYLMPEGLHNFIKQVTCRNEA